MVLVAQMVKNLPAMWETRFDPWVGISWRRAWQPTPVFLLREFHRAAWWATVNGGLKDSDTTERLTLSLSQCTSLHRELLEVDW